MNKNKPKFLKFIIFTDLLLLIYIAGSYFFAGEIIDFKQRTMDEDRNNQKITGFQDFQLPPPTELRFRNQEGLEFAAWYFPNSFKRDCGVLLLHGLTGTRWGVMKYAPIFWKTGCSIFAYDHRKHGESQGKLGTFGYHEKNDLLDALDFFSRESGIPPERIGILGESLGAATALQAMAITDKKYSFLVAESPYKDLDSIVGKKAVEIYGSWVKIFIPLAYWIAEYRADFVIDEVSPLKSAEKIDMPVLIIHSRADDYTPVSHSEEIFAQLKSSRKKLVITDWNSKHARSINDDYTRFEKIVLDFLEKHLDY